MAEPDNPDRGRMSDDDSPRRDAPVRSAPLRRSSRRTAKTVDDPAVADETVADETVADGARGQATDEVAPGDVAPDEVAPAPEEVERALGYRERRRRREAASPDDSPGGRVRYHGRRGGSTKMIVTVSALSVVIVGCLVATVLFALGIGRIEDKQDLRAEYATFARQMVVDLTSLSPDNVDEAMKTMEDKTSGRAHQQMQASMQQAISLVRDQNIETKSTIISDAVTEATPDEGTVILVYGWQMQPEKPGEQTIVQTFRWRVQITRINGDLKMTNFEWVT